MYDLSTAQPMPTVVGNTADPNSLASIGASLGSGFNWAPFAAMAGQALSGQRFPQFSMSPPGVPRTQQQLDSNTIQLLMRALGGGAAVPLTPGLGTILNRG